MVIFLIIAMSFVVLDRFLKILALRIESFYLFGDILKFNFVPNFNMAFSLPFTGLFLNLLIILIIGFLLAETIYLFRTRLVYKASILIFIVAGAASNLFDRLSYGFVIDYFDLKYLTIFNLADVMIVGGMLFLILANNSNQGVRNG